jgi:hypothetical protein
MNVEDAKTIDELFDLWRPKYKQFSNDGGLEGYGVSRPRIAFLLKESNDGFVEIRDRSHGPKGTSPRFWRNLSMWTYITTECLNGRECTFENALAVKERPLAEAAYVNIKKNAQSNSKSTRKDLRRYIQEDYEFLARQIEILAAMSHFAAKRLSIFEVRLNWSMLMAGFIIISSD